MNMRAFIVALSVVAAGLSGCGPKLADPPAARASAGALGASKIFVAAPARWNGKLLILAHGYVAPGLPRSADFNIDWPFYKGLLNDGWIVASTSYRRNGAIIHDACDDIAQLRAHVEGRFGQPKQVFVLGSSMGGAIGTMIAENPRQNYTGVLLIGAAMWMHDADKPHTWTHQPKIPVLFLTNQDEIAGPVAYAKQVEPPAVIPACWLVKRNGHCNVRQMEKRAALDALVHWADTGKVDRDKDGTIVPKDVPSVAVFKDDRAYAKAAEVGSSYGNITTQFVQADLERLGIAPGSKFVVGMGSKQFSIKYGAAYSDVPQGDWVAFMTADGWLQVSRNYANAANALGCKAGDEIYVCREAAKQ